MAIIVGTALKLNDTTGNIEIPNGLDVEEAISASNLSGTNTGDQTLPVKAIGSEITTGTDDAKFATAKAIKDAGLIVSAFAVAAKGVTNGDSHDHSGGDGAQIAYSGLSGLPTLGTAAAQNTTAFEAAGAIATHAAVQSGVHGIAITAAKTLTVQKSITLTSAGDSAVITLPNSTSTLLATNGSAASLTDFPTLNQNTTGSAATLTTARAINGVSFNGSADITVDSLPIVAAPASDHTVSGVRIAFTAGENLVFGDVVYMKSDGKVWKADANGSGTYPVVGMASATISADASGTFLIMGVARDDSWNWTLGGTAGAIYLSTTAGALTQTQPSATDDAIHPIAHAIHADRLLFISGLFYISHT